MKARNYNIFILDPKFHLNFNYINHKLNTSLPLKTPQLTTSNNKGLTPKKNTTQLRNPNQIQHRQ
jgi:hypothetical protein